MFQKRERKKEKEANEIVSENNTAACNDIDLLVPVEEFCNIFPGLLLFLILRCGAGSVTLYHLPHASQGYWEWFLWTCDFEVNTKCFTG